MAIRTLTKETLLYKGTTNINDDPLTTKSEFGNYLDHNNMFKWFALDNKVADIYTRGTGCVWVYQLKSDMNVLQITPTAPAHAMNILNSVIMKNGANFYLNNSRNSNPSKKPLNDLLGTYGKLPCCNIYDALKTPFGLVSTKEQSDVTGTALTDIDSEKKLFQRYSFHHLDKYLVKFMYDYRADINAATQNTINGYEAPSWESKWYNVKFHEEICLFETGYISVYEDKTPVIFIGRYVIDGTDGIPKFIGPDNKVLATQPQDPNNCRSMSLPCKQSQQIGGGPQGQGDKALPKECLKPNEIKEGLVNLKIQKDEDDIIQVFPLPSSNCASKPSTPEGGKLKRKPKIIKKKP